MTKRKASPQDPKSRQPEVTPHVPEASQPTVTPQVPDPNPFVPVYIGDLIESDPRCRTRRGGATRLNVPCTRELVEVGRLHNKENYFPYVRLVEGKLTGSYYLVPTDKDDPHKLEVTWTDAGHVAHVSLRKLLRMKKLKIKAGHNLVMDCGRTDLPDDGPAVELRFSEAREEPIQTRYSRTASPAATAQQEAAPGQMPPE